MQLHYGRYVDKFGRPVDRIEEQPEDNSHLDGLTTPASTFNSPYHSMAHKLASAELAILMGRVRKDIKDNATRILIFDSMYDNGISTFNPDVYELRKGIAWLTHVLTGDVISYSDYQKKALAEDNV